MNIVNESNLGKIKSIFNDNASNSHYYKIIDKTFNGIIKNLEFAKPIIQVNKGVIIWQSTAVGPYLSYSLLDKESKQYIDALIHTSLNEMAIILSENKDQDFLDNIIEIPNEDSIFYTKDSDDNIHVILTEWGYTKDEHLKSEGVLKKILSSTMKSFIIKFKSNKNEFLEGIDATISTEDLNLKAASNKEGLIKLNNLRKGNTLVIASINDSFEAVSLKVDLEEEHTIIVRRNHTLSFNVIDSNNRPVANCNFLFKSKVFTNKNFQTDESGSYNFQHPEEDGDFYIFSKDNNELLFDTLPSQNSSYTLVYDPPEEEVQSIADYKEDLPAKKSIELEFLNWRRKPIVNQLVDFYGQNGKTSYVTNDYGLVNIDSLNNGIEYGIFMNFKNTNWKKEFTHTDDNRYTFIVKKKRFLWLWFPLSLFFLCLLLIPSQITHHYSVLDRNTKRPINLANISSSNASIYQVQGHEDKTDSLGYLSIDYGKYALYKQIFKNPTTDIFVSKSGYESLNAKVPLGYFKTQESKIYLSRLSRPLNDEESIGNCNSGGDGDNAGGNSVKEFDLKQDKGEFLFKYNTGDTHADIINIYDCSKSEISKEQPVWSIDEASGGDKFVPISFSSRIITVEVIGGGNTQSIWMYLVQCP